MLSSAAPRLQRHGSEGERGQGGLGSAENGKHGRGDTAMVVGVEVDDTFAESPLLLLFFYFPVFFKIQKLFWDLIGALKHFRKICK